jgi:hypothetical protein
VDTAAIAESEDASAAAASKAAPAGAADAAKVIEEWRRFFGTSADAVTETPAQIRQALRRYFEKSTGGADARAYLQNVALEARMRPVQGLMRALTYLPYALARYPSTLWRLLTTNVQDAASGWKTKTLAAPGANLKYLIFSDLHRDARADDRGPFNIGSIDHFKANARLYCRILDYAKQSGYTVIEAGDCEELWFIRDPADYQQRNAKGETGVVKKVREIIETYNTDAPKGQECTNVYRRLRDLHKQGRYFRLYGNHDLFLKTDPAAKQVLLAEFQKDGAPPLEIYDAFVIPGIKSMLDRTWFELLNELMSAAKGGPTAPTLQSMLKGRLGLDSNDYNDQQSKCRMLVTHGHQFDFWNCEENQLLGLIISNTVATFIDRNMDPFLDLQGLAIQGNPLFQFDDLFAALPILNSWVSRQPSVKTAHRVQHLDNGQRQLTDSIMFKESLAALVGTFGLALNDDQGRSPAQSRKELDLTTMTGVREFVRRHHSHHICIGHTHNPHSQPFLTLGAISLLAPPLAPVIDRLRKVLPIEPMLKTRYFNSGTGGWMEGVIWAIEIDQTGQARLVYWTENTLVPEYMDWELQPLPQALRSQLLNGLTTALPNLVKDASPDLAAFIRELERRLSELRVTPEEIRAIVYERLVVPIDALGAALSREAAGAKRHVEQVLRDVDKTVNDAEEFLKKQWQGARDFFSDVVLTVKQRSLGGAVSDMDRFAITAPVPAESREQLARLTSTYAAQGYGRDESLHYAALALGAFERFPRNWPTEGRPIETLAPRAKLFDAPSPALHAVLSTLWMFPPAGQKVEIGGDDLTSRVELLAGGSSLRLTVTVQKRGVAPSGAANRPVA